MNKLPKNWTTCELDDVLLKISNGANVIQYEEKFGYPICRIETIWNENIDLGRVKYIKENDKEFVEKYALQFGDILLSHINSDAHLGKTGLFKNQVDILIHGINILLIRPVEHFSSDFLNYQFKHLRAKGVFIDAAQRAVNQSSINQKKLKSFQIVVAPLNEQHRIVAKIEELFSELDKGIENLKTARAQLKVYRQALLKHAFEGKLTAQWRAERRAKRSVAPAKAGAQPLNDMDSRLPPAFARVTGNDYPLETADALLKRIQQERAQRHQQQLAEWEAAGKQGSKPKTPKSLPPLTAEELAELPVLPNGWLWVRLGEVFSDSPKNGIYKSADYYGSGFSIIRIDDFYDGTLCRTSGFKKVKLSVDEIKTFTAHAGDILINRVNSIEYLGKCCEVKGLAEPVVFESNIMKTTFTASLVSTFFVTSYLSSHFGRKRLCANAKHAVNQASINQTDVSLTPIPLTQLDEQIVISEHLGAHLSEIDQLELTITASLQQAEALRQSILKKAFSGQLVPQDPNDEPASALLARIKTERATAKKNLAVRPKSKRG
ncbi:restriction endonuclease subunit S [Nitrosomonas mobilis]|uniref:restriction endonuclease subunit S n=1 Tax=Nitrosomonas mobilis TaxID=51642 RepID=UPI001C40A300|nr:restriction endonuclease subunit S [Nitrosomonas mobilis]